MSFLSVLKITIDGHFHGSSEVPKPWVAEILGPDPKYGLRREFLRPMNDWADAKRAWSGNIYGRVARFHLRDGRLYEVCRLRGSSSRRHSAREFLRVCQGKQTQVKPEDALAEACGNGIPYRMTEAPDTWIARVTGLGTPERLGYILQDDQRLYLLADGLYEIGRQGFLGVADSQVTKLNHAEALQWLK